MEHKTGHFFALHEVAFGMSFKDLLSCYGTIGNLVFLIMGLSWPLFGLLFLFLVYHYITKYQFYHGK